MNPFTQKHHLTINFINISHKKVAINVRSYFGYNAEPIKALYNIYASIQKTQQIVSLTRKPCDNLQDIPVSLGLLEDHETIFRISQFLQVG